MSLSFGTDGVRGEAYTQLTTDFVYALGVAASRVLPGERFLIGRDTRESGVDFEQALAHGLSENGASIGLLGVVPTPAVAWLAAADSVPGAMISASHNPFHDIGIKLFAAGGLKLSDAVQDEIQTELDQLLAEGVTAPEGSGAWSDDTDQLPRWEEAVVQSLEGRSLSGVTVVLDCANGSNSAVAAPVFERLGARVIALSTEPDGRNINANCGSTHLQALQAAVVEHGADLGFAFDGDADRVLAVDDQGQTVDGDQIIAMCATDFAQLGQLDGDSVVVTVMSNLGFRRAMDAAGIAVVETGVGDRYVLEALDDGGFALGGEQSGHVIFRKLATTGDGLLTAVRVTDLAIRDGRSFGDIASAAMTRFPQVLENVRVAERIEDLHDRLGPAIREVEAELSDQGRVLIRPSGTEPLIRVMVEAATAEQAGESAKKLVAAVESLQ